MSEDVRRSGWIKEKFKATKLGRISQPVWANPHAFRHMVEKVDGIFDGVTPNKEITAKWSARPYPDKRYIIFFTPRSGSGRLGDLIEKTGCLRNPGEPFNPALTPNIAKRLATTNLDSFVDTLMRARCRNGTFGCEITFRQLHATFGNMDEFLRLLQPTVFFWLIRENLVAQAVSLSRPQQTRVAHSHVVDDAAQTIAERTFMYDPVAIRKALFALFWQEERMEELFDHHGLSPLRLSYESSVNCATTDLMQAVAHHIGISLQQMDHIESSQSKLKGSKAGQFVEQFKQENQGLLSKLEERRRARLQGIVEISAPAS